ncbi:MAG TPA: FAD-dependent oxidoreductase [Limnochordales bacterium]
MSSHAAQPEIVTYSRQIPVRLAADVAVVGGGAAGVNAAVAAARLGLDVLLVERHGYLGGTSTGVLDTFYGFFTPGAIPKRVVGGIPWEIVQKLLARRAAIMRPNTYGAGMGVTYNPTVLKFVYDELAEAAGVRLLLHSFCTDVLMAGDAITGLVVDGKQGLFAVKARVIIDASGDADVAARAGAPLEQAGVDGPVQSATTTFTLGGVDVERARAVPRRELEALMREAHTSGRYRLPRQEGSVHITPHPGVMVANMTRMPAVDGTDPVSLTAAEVEGRRQVQEYVRFLVENVPGYERAFLLGVSTHVGIRESRRIIGEYRLTADDVLSARKFPDGIAQCGAPIEDHHGGSDTRWQYLPEGEVYHVPYRCLVPQKVDGLLVAGRCLSATHDAHASVRSIGQCMAMGQAAGVAAALALRRKTSVRDVDTSALRAQLEQMGALLHGGVEPGDPA